MIDTPLQATTRTRTREHTHSRTLTCTPWHAHHARARARAPALTNTIGSAHKQPRAHARKIGAIVVLAESAWSPLVGAAWLLNHRAKNGGGGGGGGGGGNRGWKA
jgi:hypothetical protein